MARSVEDVLKEYKRGKPGTKSQLANMLREWRAEIMEQRELVHYVYRLATGKEATELQVEHILEQFQAKESQRG